MMIVYKWGAVMSYYTVIIALLHFLLFVNTIEFIC